MPKKLLELENLDVARGGILILRDINLYVKKGEVIALIGPNGAGKTTLFSSIVGLHKITNGRIKYDDKLIHEARQEEIVKHISLVPQEAAVFPYLTVLENLWVALDVPKRKIIQHEIFEILRPLKDKMSQEAITLSGGERQMLALAIGLVRKCQLLILDEPSLGLAPLLVKNILKMIREVSESFGISILISEQTPSVLDISDRVYVLEGGQIRIQGKSKELKQDERITKVYLGMSM